MNKRIFGGKPLDADRVLLESQIDQIQNREWFNNRDNSWILKKGSMSPQFLHLEDNKACFLLESLLINGESVSDTSIVLQEISSFYSDLYACADLRSALEIEEFLASLSELPQVIPWQ